MKRLLFSALACAAVLAASSAAYALRIAGPIIQPVPVRVAQAETIILGKVTSVEEKNQMAPRFKGDKEKGEYRVFTVKVEKAIKGGAGLTHVKVGCLVPAAVKPPIRGEEREDNIKGAPFRRPRPFPVEQPAMLEKGQEVLLYLKSHPTETFHILAQQADIINKQAGNFKGDLEMTVKAAKVSNDLMGSLKGKDDKDRMLAAAMLIMQYRNANGPGPYKEVEVPAAESKLVLEALASADFSQPRTGRFDPMDPLQLFYNLNPQEAGFQPPMVAEQGPAIKKWLGENTGKWKLKKFVLEEKK